MQKKCSAPLSRKEERERPANAGERSENLSTHFFNYSPNNLLAVPTRILSSSPADGPRLSTCEKIDTGSLSGQQEPMSSRSAPTSSTARRIQLTGAPPILSIARKTSSAPACGDGHGGVRGAREVRSPHPRVSPRKHKSTGTERTGCFTAQSIPTSTRHPTCFRASATTLSVCAARLQWGCEGWCSKSITETRWAASPSSGPCSATRKSA